MMVQTGAADVVMAGGVESMSNVEYDTTDVRWRRCAAGTSCCTIAWSAAASVAAGRAVRRDLRNDRNGGELRARLRDHARRGRRVRSESHQRAAAAWDADNVCRRGRRGPGQTEEGRAGCRLASDEGVRADATVETLGGLRPLMKAASSRPVTRASRTMRRRRASSSPRTSSTNSASSLWRFMLDGRRQGAIRRRWALGLRQRSRKALRPHRPRLERCRSRRAQRGVSPRKCLRSCAPGSGIDVTSSTSTAPAFRSGIRSARRACASWRRSCTRWSAARRATGWRRCASAAVRAWPRCLERAADRPTRQRFCAAFARFRGGSLNRAGRA